MKVGCEETNTTARQSGHGLYSRLGAPIGAPISCPEGACRPVTATRARELYPASRPNQLQFDSNSSLEPARRSGADVKQAARAARRHTVDSLLILPHEARVRRPAELSLPDIWPGRHAGFSSIQRRRRGLPNGELSMRGHLVEPIVGLGEESDLADERTRSPIPAGCRVRRNGEPRYVAAHAGPEDRPRSRAQIIARHNRRPLRR